MSITLGRIVKSGWKNFKRNRGLSFVVIFIMVLVISLATSLFLLQETFQFLVNTLQERVNMYVYFNEELTNQDILEIQDEIARLPEIKEIEYVSKEQALQKFSQRHKEDQAIIESLEELGTNPLLASLNIRAWEPDQYAAISSFLNNSSFKGLIAKIDYQQKKPVIQKLFSITSGINKTSIIISIILAVIVILVAFNTIRLAIYNSKQEIETMRLVGASNWFIRGPFFVQGAIAGFFAALITLLIFTIILLLLSPKIEMIIPGLGLSGYFFGNLGIIFLLQLLTGMGLGILSSWLATRKYLRV